MTDHIDAYSDGPDTSVATPHLAERNMQAVTDMVGRHQAELAQQPTT